jgi:hypothetical protein
MYVENTIGPFALRRLGHLLRARYLLPTKLPFRLLSLIAQLKRTTKEDDYLSNAAESIRLAQTTPSSSDKTRLVRLAEAWVELADKAHEDNERPRRPTVLHPLVRKRR